MTYTSITLTILLIGSMAFMLYLLNKRRQKHDILYCITKYTYKTLVIIDAILIYALLIIKPLTETIEKFLEIDNNIRKDIIGLVMLFFIALIISSALLFVHYFKDIFCEKIYIALVVLINIISFIGFTVYLSISII